MNLRQDPKTGRLLPAFSKSKADAIRRLNLEFGLTYKYILKLIDISEETFYEIVKQRGAYK